MTLSDLPAVNAALNTLSTIFLTCGYVFIRRQRQVAHRNCMIGAVISSQGRKQRKLCLSTTP